MRICHRIMPPCPSSPSSTLCFAIWDGLRMRGNELGALTPALHPASHFSVAHQGAMVVTGRGSATARPAPTLPPFLLLFRLGRHAGQFSWNDPRHPTFEKVDHPVVVPCWLRTPRAEKAGLTCVRNVRSLCALSAHFNTRPPSREETRRVVLRGGHFEVVEFFDRWRPGRNGGRTARGVAVLRLVPDGRHSTDNALPAE